MSDSNWTRSIGEWRAVYLLRRLGETLRTGADLARQHLTGAAPDAVSAARDTPPDVAQTPPVLAGDGLLSEPTVSPP